MGWTETIAAVLVLALLALTGGVLHARRGIGRLSLVPWDYLMLAALILLFAALAHGVTLWREGWPLPFALPTLGGGG